MIQFSNAKYILAISLLVSVLALSCRKEAGEGGNATIYGKVYVKNYNATFTQLKEEYYGQDEDVYIIYGDDRSYGNRVRTSYNGTFEFKYLYPGNYTIYCYSKDSSLTTNAMIVRKRKVTVDKKQHDVDAGVIVILK